MVRRLFFSMVMAGIGSGCRGGDGGGRAAPSSPAPSSPAAVATAPDARASTPEGPDALPWIAALYPKSVLEGDVLTRVSRDGMPGKIRATNVRRTRIRDGFVVAFLLELEDADRAGKYLQVLHFDAQGKYLGKAPEPFPIGGTWDKGEPEMDPETELALRGLQPIEGTDRAVLLDFTPTTTAMSSDQYQVVALTRAGTLALGETFGHGTRTAGDMSTFTRTFSKIQAQGPRVIATVHGTGELATGEPAEPSTETVTLFTLD